MGDSVLKILKEYLRVEKLKQEKEYKNLSMQEKNEFRIENDKDAKYYYEIEKLTQEEALFADTVISFWTPYSRLLKLEANWTTYKTLKSLKALIDQIEAKRENKYTLKIREVNKKVEEFAGIYCSRGNYMLLPARSMNNQRYRVTEDRIDLTMYECFEKGVLAKFFKDNSDLVDWINAENMNALFIDNDITKNCINWFTNEEKPKWFSEMNQNDIYEYLHNATTFIEKRNVDVGKQKNVK